MEDLERDLPDAAYDAAEAYGETVGDGLPDDETIVERCKRQLRESLRVCSVCGERYGKVSDHAEQCRGPEPEIEF